MAFGGPLALHPVTFRRMADHHRRNRGLRRLIVGVVLEAALLIVAKLGPALRSLVWLGMVIVAVVIAISLWQSVRPRAADDRRHGDRRHPAPDESVP